jgi:hypothetical protein
MIYSKTVNEIKRDQIMVTLEEAILTVNQLPLEQREMLLEIIKNQMIEARREEIATDAKEAIAAFHRGELKSQSLENIIVELQASLTED